MSNRGICTATLICTLISFSEAETNPQNYIDFQHIGRDQGLSQSTGNTFLQDHQGYMWIGTRNGLNLYNSSDMTVFRHDPLNASTICGNNISVLFEDSHNTLWVGTAGAGINRFDRDTYTFTCHQTDYVDHGSSISDNTVTAMIEDINGELWIGTTAALNFFDPEEDRFVHFYASEDVPNSLSDSHITTLFVDSYDTFWIGTADGLNIWNREFGNFEQIWHDPDDPHSISHNHITSIYEDRQGDLWFGTGGGGLNHYDPQTGHFRSYHADENDPNSLSDPHVTSILQDSDGNLWVGTVNRGLNLLDRKTGHFRHFVSDGNNPYSLTNNAVYSLYESSNRMLWIGTETGGINLLDLKPANFETYADRQFQDFTLNENSVLSFLEDENGRFYVGTGGGGLNIFNRTTRQFLPDQFDPEMRSGRISSDIVLSLMEDRNGHIWLGYYGDGLSRYQPETGMVTHYRHDPDDPGSPGSNHVYSIIEDSNGDIWIGTNGGGISKYDPYNDNFIRLREYANGYDATRKIYEDSRGTIWVGSYGGGLRAIHPETNELMEHFYHGNRGLNSHVVIAIHEDREQNFWVGTIGGGLHLLDRQTMSFSSYSLADGMPTLDVYGIEEDKSGNLWLSTDNGLVRFDPLYETFTWFGAEYGLQGPEFNPLASYRDREGYLYFGGINGFNRFHPDSLRVDDVVSPVVFTDFKINNVSVVPGSESPLKKHISQTKELHLPHGQSILTFDYITLNYNFNEPNEYAYKLEGFDTDWHYAGNTNTVTYTNLSPGTYTFRVQTANLSGIWGNQMAVLDLVIVPPFWQTTWFYILVTVMIAGFIGLVFHIRVTTVTRRNHLLEQEVANRTSDLSKSNKELKKTLETLKDTRSQLVEKAHKAGMADLAAGVLHDMGNILNSVTTSVGLTEEILINSELRNFRKANKLLRENIQNLEHFILKDQKGKMLMEYYLGLEEPLDREAGKLIRYNQRLAEKIKMINDVVYAQQRFARMGGVKEKITLSKFIADTLRLLSGNFEKELIAVKTRFEQVDRIKGERSKLVHSLINLLTNAAEAMEHLAVDQKVITVKLRQNEEHIFIDVSDNGKGLEEAESTKVFNHGYTTKTDGFGFGLHSASNYLKEMGGSIRAYSAGRDKGSTFTMILPRPQPDSPAGN